jgi:transposase
VGQYQSRFGVGFQTAAIFLSVDGDNPDRLKSEGALASMCGVNPLPESSGKTTKHLVFPMLANNYVRFF